MLSQTKEYKRGMQKRGSMEKVSFRVETLAILQAIVNIAV